MPWTIEDLEPRMVSIDQDPTFWAWVLKDQRWNGFAIPFFELTQAQAVTRMTFENDLTEDEAWVFMPDGRLFQVYPEHAGAPPEEVKPIEVPGIEGKLYPIGAWNWTWMDDPTLRGFTNKADAGIRTRLDEQVQQWAETESDCPYGVCAGFGKYEDSSVEDGPMASDVQYCSCLHAGRAILMDRVREAGF